jgi:hypothetical protein
VIQHKIRNKFSYFQGVFLVDILDNAFKVLDQGLYRDLVGLGVRDVGFVLRKRRQLGSAALGGEVDRSDLVPFRRLAGLIWGTVADFV